MSEKDNQVEVCRRCGHIGKPVQKLNCYICEKCRVIMGYGTFNNEGIKRATTFLDKGEANET